MLAFVDVDGGTRGAAAEADSTRSSRRDMSAARELRSCAGWRGRSAASSIASTASATAAATARCCCCRITRTRCSIRRSIWATAGRDVRFLAKSTLFESALRPILAGAGAIPVYRKHRSGRRHVEERRNVRRRVRRAGRRRRGLHVSRRHQPLDGPARAAANRRGAHGACRGARGTSVALVPVGLNFDRKTAFRSRVTVVFGQPFSGRDLLPQRIGRDSSGPGADRQDRGAHARASSSRRIPHADAALVDRVDRLYAAARGRPARPPRTAGDAGERSPPAWSGCARPIPSATTSCCCSCAGTTSACSDSASAIVTSTGRSRTRMP